MSDVPEGAVEAPQSGAAQQDQFMPDGWTGEWNPQRAKATIDRLREFESDAQAYRKLQEDEDARLEAIKGWGFDLADDEPEEPFQPDYRDQEFLGGEPDPLQEVMTRQERLEQWQLQQEARQMASQISDHIDHLATEANVELSDYERDQLFLRATQGEISDRQTKRIFDDHVKWVKEREDAWQKRYLDSKRAPAPPPTGKPGEEGYDPRDKTARQREIALRLHNAGLE